LVGEVGGVKTDLADCEEPAVDGGGRGDSQLLPGNAPGEGREHVLAALGKKGLRRPKLLCQGCHTCSTARGLLLRDLSQFCCILPQEADPWRS